MMMTIIINQGLFLYLKELFGVTWKKKIHGPLFPPSPCQSWAVARRKLHALSCHHRSYLYRPVYHWHLRFSACCTAGASRQSAISLKLPHISSGNNTAYANREQSKDSEVTTRNQHHHFSRRKGGETRAKVPPGPEGELLKSAWRVHFAGVLKAVKGKEGTEGGRGIDALGEEWYFKFLCGCFNCSLEPWGSFLSHLLFISSAGLKPPGRAGHVFKTKPVLLHSAAVYKGVRTHIVETQCQHTHPLWLIKEHKLSTVP